MTSHVEPDAHETDREAGCDQHIRGSNARPAETDPRVENRFEDGEVGTFLPDGVVGPIEFKTAANGGSNVRRCEITSCEVRQESVTRRKDSDVAGSSHGCSKIGHINQKLRVCAGASSI